MFKHNNYRQEAGEDYNGAISKPGWTKHKRIVSAVGKCFAIRQGAEDLIPPSSARNYAIIICILLCLLTESYTTEAINATGAFV